MVVLIVFMVGVILIYFSMVYTVYNMNVKKKFYNMNFICKILLVLICVLTLIVVLINMFYFAFTLVTSSFCNISREFRTTSDFSVYFGTID